MRATISVVEKAAEWKAVADLSEFAGKENPYEVLLKMAQLGLVSIRFRNVNGDEKLMAHFPLAIGIDGRFLGCWAERDPRIFFYHQWQRECLEASTFSVYERAKPRVITPS